MRRISRTSQRKARDGERLLPPNGGGVVVAVIPLYGGVSSLLDGVVFVVVAVCVVAVAVSLLLP